MAYYEPGQYDAIVTAQGFDVSKEKKTPCFWIRFRPVKHDGSQIDGEYEREVRLWLTDNTIDNVVERLRSMGWEGTSFKELEPGGHSFEGENIRLRCIHEQTNGKWYESWEFPALGGFQSEHKGGMGKKLDALFGKSLKGAKASQAKPQAAEQASEPAETETETDDIPF